MVQVLRCLRNEWNFKTRPLLCDYNHVLSWTHYADDNESSALSRPTGGRDENQEWISCLEYIVSKHMTISLLQLNTL